MKTTTNTGATIYTLSSHDSAWSFMRACAAKGLSAGWPASPRQSEREFGLPYHTVQVSIRTAAEAAIADALLDA